MPDQRAPPHPLPPRSVIGILGGGQLGKMLAAAAAALGFRTHVYSDEAGPAFDVATAHSRGDYRDLDALSAFARTVDVVTYEFENVPVEAAEHLVRLVPVRPGTKALAVAQDRLVEKTFVGELGIAVAPFAAIDAPGDLAAALARFGGPAILKTRRLGYDGKGQLPVEPDADPVRALTEIGNAPAVLEQRIAFACEVSVLVVRGLDGRSATYDIPRNTHGGGILRRSVVPAGLPAAVEAEARAIAVRIADALGYVGLLAVEMFHLGSDRTQSLMVNEIAPRVHNSGHWTIEACGASQFSNHIRAVAGWPLAATERHSDAEMVNLIGHDADAWVTLAADPAVCLHLYGKREARDGRKMGHWTRLSSRTQG